MASRLGRVFAHAIRPSVRAVGRSAGATKRGVSTVQHAQETSDRPWIIGSALVFGPVFLYLLTPSAKKTEVKAAQKHGRPSAKPQVTYVPDDEGNEFPASESVDPPQPSSGSQALTDSEGTTVSSEEIKDSMKQAFSEDSPPMRKAQRKKDTGPANLGDAGEKATSGEAPKEASQD
ncbi:hypothetical protein A0H81_11194 [Grifola frondosa]|uniref:Uncharacterized protein n=1 Tax=Grifola frondosa TaxID=5627 RepID=A0A1C7LWQ1_GRIFR|nr:hypothetical protein A0H81_11194 [Grifola frondosa]